MKKDFLVELTESFEHNAERNAFCVNGEFFTYKVFQALIASIVEKIRAVKNQETGHNVGVVLLNDIETYASLIACWFTGNAFVPLHPSFPKERNDFIVQEAGVKFILSSSQNSEDVVGSSDLTVISTKENDEGITPALKAPPADLDRNAYILFTSGSTGTPKGVPITRRNLGAFVRNFLSTGFSIEQTDRCLQMFELTFDVSISSFLIPLLKGATVYTVPDGIKYVEVLKLIREHQLTSLQIVPSIIRLGRSLIKRLDFGCVKNCILTGEATPVELLPDWRRCLPNARIYNFYGPTESTIYCSYYELRDNEPKSYQGLLAIGKPMGENKLVIVDDGNREVSPGEKGELLIAGDQTTNGYLNNSAKNKASFIRIGNSPNEYYRSGDLCFQDEAGDIYYCGRLDNQIKINGFRIELGEIEYILRNGMNLNNVAMLSDHQELPELITVLESDQTVDKPAIIDFLKKKLPDYMVPKRIEVLKEFPLGSSGKTDRVRIKEILSKL